MLEARERLFVFLAYLCNRTIFLVFLFSSSIVFFFLSLQLRVLVKREAELKISEVERGRKLLFSAEHHNHETNFVRSRKLLATRS